MNTKGFSATVESRSRGGVAIRLPFDPSAAWGDKERHVVTGTIAGHDVRGAVTSIGDEHYLLLGPAWCRDRAVAAGADVVVVLRPEGPQLATLPTDIRAALAGEPDARRYFESLATFYRKGYVRWIEGAKRPETRAKRISDTIAALTAGKKER